MKTRCVALPFGIVWTRAILGGGLCLVGAVFFGQGIGEIHGSWMTGKTVWAVIGALMVVAGAALLAWVWRLRSE